MYYTEWGKSNSAVLKDWWFLCGEDSAIMMISFCRAGHAVISHYHGLVWWTTGIRTFFENGRSFIATKRAYRLQFNLARHDTVPHRNVIANWVRTFEETGSTLKPRGYGRYLVPTGRGYSTYCLSFNDEAATDVPYAPRLTEGWCEVAPALTGLEHLWFFLWGYLKEKVFKHRPHTLEKLKDRIREEIGAIPVEMCQNSAENFRNRFHQCIAAGGHHLSDVIFKTWYIKRHVMYWKKIK